MVTGQNFWLNAILHTTAYMRERDSLVCECVLYKTCIWFVYKSGPDQAKYQVTSLPFEGLYIFISELF